MDDFLFKKLKDSSDSILEDELKLLIEQKDNLLKSISFIENDIWYIRQILKDRRVIKFK